MSDANSEPIKVYQRQDEIAISFNNLEEFQEYYNKNKEIIDSEPTRGLNRKYKIKGYKITRQRKKMVAIPINNSNTVDDLMEAVLLLDEKINNIQLTLESLKLKKNKQ
jgi:hypothetical protein